MSRFNTGNPLGSGDPRDLDDNAKNMDLAVNSEDSQWVDRFGRPRLPLMEQERQFQSAQDSREDRFNDFIASSGYQFAGDYGPGIEITEYNQLIRDSNGEFWRVSGQVELPYTTTGAGIPEDDALVPAGDAVLRQDLANPDKGALLVRGAVIYANTIADLQARDTGGLVEGQRVIVGGRTFTWRAEDVSQRVSDDTNQSIYIPPANGDGSAGAWEMVSGQLEDSITIPVGDGGWFSTIGGALEFLSKFQSPASHEDLENTPSITIRLSSGFVMREQVYVKDQRLGWITIVSDDEEVVVSREDITEDFAPEDDDITPSAFMFVRSIGPTIGTVFVMSTTPPNPVVYSQDGLVAYDGSHFTILPGCGFKRAQRTNIRASTCSSINADGAISDGMGVTQYGVYSKFGSKISFRSGFSGNTIRHCIRAQRNAIIEAENATVGDSVDGYCVYAAYASSINARAATIDATIAGDGAVFSSWGSTVSAANANIVGAGGVAFYCNSASRISAPSATLASINQALFASEGSVIDVRGSSISNALLGSALFNIRRGSTVVADGFAANGGGAIYVRDNSTLSAQGVNNNGGNVLLENGSSADLSNASIGNSPANTVTVESGSRANLQGASLVNSGGSAIVARDGASVNAKDADGSGSASSMIVLRGSIVNATGYTGSISSNNPLNQISERGIVFG